MNTLSEDRPDRPEAVVALGLGLLLTVTALIAAVVDQRSAHTIADHVYALYAPFGPQPDPNTLFTFLYTIGGAGVLMWLATIWGAKRRQRWVAAVATMIFLVGTGPSVLVLVVHEHGTRIFPVGWGVLSLLPCVLGFVAVVLLWMPHHTASGRDL